MLRTPPRNNLAVAAKFSCGYLHEQREDGRRLPRKPPPKDPRTHGNKGQRHGVSDGAQFLWVVVQMCSDVGREIVSNGDARVRPCQGSRTAIRPPIGMQSIPTARNQREARVACGASLDSTWARQARMTSAVFCCDFPS